jgi:UDP-N-acetylmuramate--alanine ligase
MQKKQIYLIGIKGVGMTALAQLLQRRGFSVSGVDTAEVFFTDAVLKREKIKFYNGFNIKNIPAKVDLVIHSAAYTEENNIELAESLRRGIPCIDLTQATSEIFNNYKKSIAVCGTHGKTTTTALLAFVLKQAGRDPSALIGSAVPQLGGNALAGKSDVMILEADEYKNKLAQYRPHGVILNNIDYDHPDFFKTPSAYRKAFTDFVKKVPRGGFVIANGDDKDVVRAVQKCECKVITYGASAKNKIFNIKYLILNIKNGYQYFKISQGGKDLGGFKIKLIGEHNVKNATAVIAACLELNVPIAKIKKALAEFKGLARRMERLGTYNGALIFDDYAHHPSEIKATLAAARLRYPAQKIICVFMPHTFSRTQALFKDFSKSFNDADEVILLPIYASAREKKGKVSSEDLAKKIKNARYNSSLQTCANYLKKKTQKNDVVILMGAGDAFRIWKLLRITN